MRAPGAEVAREAVDLMLLDLFATIVAARWLGRSHRGPVGPRRTNARPAGTFDRIGTQRWRPKLGTDQ
ncbi:hypothetical protein [Nocardia ignorata]|uniref:Uncharacterized protein n=1 Tax=Nocardia ignorata TaxID=145285 RepID=A0A4V3CMU6_NOCIG|nr:hypothetical protein [Nocardia ignorata]TDP31552.1 hypothetical protein DFR75_108157 [Nocardia ignorata]